MIRVVTYSRVSTDEQAEKDLSIPAQKKAQARWLADRPNHELVREFVDEGESAFAPAEKRPEFMAMIGYCCRNRVDIVLFHKIDRFSRHKAESAIFKEILAQRGTKAVSICEQFDNETPAGFLLEGVLETFAQFMSMNLGTETLKGMSMNAELGWFNGGKVPYGYQTIRVKDAAGREHQRLSPGEDAQIGVVREIFELAVSHGRGCRHIAGLLNARGVPSPSGGTWSPASVNFILRNPVYVGDSVWYKTKKAGRTARRKNPEPPITVRDTHAPLVERALFDRYETQRGERSFCRGKRTASTRPVGSLLSSMIHCGHCGHTFYGVRRHSTERGKPVERVFYTCHGYINKGKTVCKPLHLRREWIEDLVLDALRDHICTDAARADLRARVVTFLQERRRAFAKDSKALAREIAECDAGIQNYYRAIATGLDPTLCKQLVGELSERRSRLEREAELLAQEDIYERAIQRNVDAIERFAAQFRDGFRELPFGTQREVIQRFVARIEVQHHREVEITLRVPMDTSGLDTLLAGGPGGEGEGGSGSDLAALGVQRGRDAVRLLRDRQLGANYFFRVKLPLRAIVLGERSLDSNPSSRLRRVLPASWRTWVELESRILVQQITPRQARLPRSGCRRPRGPAPQPPTTARPRRQHTPGRRSFRDPSALLPPQKEPLPPPRHPHSTGRASAPRGPTA